MVTLEGWESNSDSESEESSEEDDLRTGFFTADFSAGFDFWGFAAYGEGVYERGSRGRRKLSRHFLWLWR